MSRFLIITLFLSPLFLLTFFSYYPYIFPINSQHPIFRRTSSLSVLSPISTSPPPAFFKSFNHPQRPSNLDPEFRKLGIPIPTNKFYTNLLVDNAQFPVYPLPYALRFESGVNNGLSGFSISNVDEENKVFGPAASYFYSAYTPSITISSKELQNSTKLLLSNPDDFSITARLVSNNSTNPTQPQITLPIVRGMAFVTAQYRKMSPVFESGVGFNVLSSPIKLNHGVIKYKVTLADGSNWLIYAINDDGISILRLSKTKLNRIESTSGVFSGIIQIAKVPKGNAAGESVYDKCAGTFATKALLDVQNQGNVGSYTLSWITTTKTSAPLLHYALPHHITSFKTSFLQETSLTLTSPSTGQMKAYIGSTWLLVESSLNQISFLPPNFASKLTPSRINTIKAQAIKDVSLDFKALSNLDTTYFSGKALAKFGLVCLVVNDVLKDKTLGNTCLSKLQIAMKAFISNTQQYPLRYDATWKGIVSSAAFVTKNIQADFGASYYNDHHFHYGYFVYTAAIIRHLNESWGAANAAWVNSLIRDVSNPSKNDPYFPTFRSFDWFAGHSWASGIFASQDGNNEESTSEDYNFFYATKLWAQTSPKTVEMSNLGKLMDVILAVESRTVKAYFLLEDENTVQPKAFLPNKVSGILWETKLDHTTFFSQQIEAIQGIQMIPITPIVPYFRTKRFISEEWSRLLSPILPFINNSWKSLLYTNHAIVEPNTAYNFFASNSSVQLDDGLSRTWALFWCAVQ
ncbi:9989_t:CDS:2 [Acaulospora morrowiae]|uniref:glucan endo-1,3-beta-D-glucosidase n=1 Tax=Acaulospora morrowiae TaxID=94023 RepID=A0A9N8YYM5_9GLOM|nr:9989_t:CDS:2 [Acaulospora morrowiae]